ncbi:MAG: hypothetical protein OXP71_02030 [Candidatus Poribacteria bacterium]|nr:hypothetical protein [Candidatus Poribacteria bacterium]
MKILNTLSIPSVSCVNSGNKCQAGKHGKDWQGSVATEFAFDPMTLTDCNGVPLCEAESLGTLMSTGTILIEFWYSTTLEKPVQH